MSPTSRLLCRLLVVAAAINVLGLPIAIFQAEPWHATVHAGLALISGFGALLLRHRRPDRLDPFERLDASHTEPTALGQGQQEPFVDRWLKDDQARERVRHDE